MGQAYPDEAYRAEVIARWMGLAGKAMAGSGEIERREYRVTCKDGTVKTMVIFGVLVSGKVFVMFEDITALKLAAEERLSLERQLLHAQKMESLGIMAGGIAHDFNNLLTAILGNTDLALAELPRHRRCGRWWSRSRPRPCAPPSSPGRCSSSPGGASWRPSPSSFRPPCARWGNCSPRPSPRRPSCDSTSPRISRRSRPTRPSCARSS